MRFSALHPCTLTVEQNRKIIHIDMDAFYASVEQRDFPEYRGKPLIVGGDPQKRGVVAAASYEVRKYGVHSAMPSARAARLCPHAIFVKPRFEVYREVSHQIREVFFDFTDLVEPLSLDEAYLDVTENHFHCPSATLIAREIKKRIKQKTDLVASAGVSINKFLAKVASDLDKPDGLAVITPDEVEEFLEDLEIGEFHGIGEATERKMKKMGIDTGRDLKALSEYELVEAFGKAGRHYYRIVRGIDPREVKTHRIRKSIGKENTFNQDIDDISWLKQYLETQSQKVAERAQRLDAAGKTVTLKLRYADFETITRSSTFAGYLDQAEELAEVAKNLVEETEAGARSVRLVGVTLSNLNLQEERVGIQLDLFKDQDSPES